MLCNNVYQRFLKLVKFVILCFVTLIIAALPVYNRRVTELGRGAELMRKAIDTVKAQNTITLICSVLEKKLIANFAAWGS